MFNSVRLTLEDNVVIEVTAAAVRTELDERAGFVGNALHELSDFGVRKVVAVTVDPRRVVPTQQIVTFAQLR